MIRKRLQRIGLIARLSGFSERRTGSDSSATYPDRQNKGLESFIRSLRQAINGFFSCRQSERLPTDLFCSVFCDDADPFLHRLNADFGSQCAEGFPGPFSYGLEQRGILAQKLLCGGHCSSVQELVSAGNKRKSLMYSHNFQCSGRQGTKE